MTTSVQHDTPPAYISLENSISQEITVIQNHALTTPEGRSYFLTSKLFPLIEKINALNQEIISLAQEASSLQEDAPGARETLFELSSQVEQKMAMMKSLLPILETSKTVAEDFSRLDAIVEKCGSLDPSEQDVVNRVAFLCQAVDMFSAE